jgi:diguanylate cyclase (GGDEF)-like protein
VRLAQPSTALRGLVRRLDRFRVEVGLDPKGAVHPAVAEVLKLAQLEPDKIDLHLERAAGFFGIVVSCGEERYDLDQAALASGAEGPMFAALAAVMPPETLAKAAMSGATELARAEVLRAAVDGMVVASGTEAALGTFLGAIVSPAGLGFQRAALFAFDRAKGSYVGTLALGPASETEAQRVVQRPADGPPSGRAPILGAQLTDRIRGIELAWREERDEVAAVLAGEPALVRTGAPVRSPGLAKLGPPSEFVLARVAVKAHVLGLVYADHRFPAKSVDPERAAALERYASHAALAWQTIRLSREVDELARYDALTGLPNRREFEARLTHEQSRVRRSRDPLSVLFVEVDNLDETNQKKGRAAGDALLRRVGQFLREELRAHDMGARFGGDALAVILPGAGAFEAASVAKRLGVVSHRRGVSLSIGVASFPDDTDHPDDLVPLAEKNLEAARSDGGGRASLSEVSDAIVFASEDGDSI